MRELASSAIDRSLQTKRRTGRKRSFNQVNASIKCTLIALRRPQLNWDLRMKRSSAQTARFNSKPMSWMNISTKKSNWLLKRHKRYRLWSLTQALLVARVETSWSWFLVTLLRDRKMTKVNQFLRRLRNIWLYTELDAKVARRISVLSAIQSHTIQARHVIRTLLHLADSVEKKWSNHPQVWFLHLRTFAESLIASIWCSSPATSSFHAVTIAAVQRQTQNVCHVSIKSALKSCQKLNNQRRTKMNSVQSATLQQ